MVAITLADVAGDTTVVGLGEPFQRTTQVGCGVGEVAPARELPKLIVRENACPPAWVEAGEVVKMSV